MEILAMPELPFDSYVAAILANGIIQHHQHTAEDAVNAYAEVLQALQKATGLQNS